VYYLLADHLGSTASVVNAAGVEEESAKYYPYGSLREGGLALTDKGFTGQQEEGTAFGLYHYGARFYSTRLGRFLSADPLVANSRTLVANLALSSVQGLELSAELGALAPSQGPNNPQSLNRYGYALNNPLRYTDPTGLDINSDCRWRGDCPPTQEEREFWAFLRLLNDYGTPFLRNEAFWKILHIQQDPSCQECRNALKGIYAATLAVSQIGADYEWGAKGQDLNGDGRIDFDCSGLVYWVYQQLGIDVGVSTYSQWPNTDDISRSELRPGDLVFYDMGPNGPEHVAIYIGDGMLVEAPHPGAQVQARPLDSSPVGYRRPRY
jgi:RHS repeat-associated protein